MEKLKDGEISEEFQLQFSICFGILEQIRNIEDEWQKFTNEMKEYAEAAITRKRDTRREHWISEEARRLVNGRKQTKKNEIKQKQKTNTGKKMPHTGGWTQQ